MAKKSFSKRKEIMKDENVEYQKSRKNDRKNKNMSRHNRLSPESCKLLDN